MLYAIIGMLVIIADQALKFWVAGHLTPYTEIVPVIPGILSLQSVQNSGAAFGFLSGSGARIPFIILAGVFALAVIIALATNLISGKLARWCIVLVTAGGLSNCIDRVISGYVIDMFKFEFINFPVFNLADVFITVFAILFALAVIFGKTRKDVDEDEDFLEDEEEEEAPKVSRRKARREKRRAAAELEEEDEDLAPAPAPKKSKKKALGRKAAEEEEPAAAVEAPAPKKAAAKQAPAEDPFADWDRANATASAAKARRSEVIAAARQPSGASAAQRASAAQPVRNNAQVAAAASAQSAGTASAARPASRAARPAAASPSAAPRTSAAKPAAASRPAAKPVVEEEFSLDDILSEFK